MTPEMCLSRVDLPEPLRPSSATVSPVSTIRETSFRAWNFLERSPLRPLTSQTTASLMERVWRSTNSLLILETSIAFAIYSS